jgi:hypothetical protein
MLSAPGKLFDFAGWRDQPASQMMKTWEEAPVGRSLNLQIIREKKGGSERSSNEDTVEPHVLVRAHRRRP